jgi:outer membrane protein TolC
VTAAAAGLESAEQETSYAVSRTYVTALFAREQERIAGSVITRLTAIRDTAQQQVEAGARGVTVSDVNRTNVFLGLAQTRQIQASQGVKRAMVALKEAIGLGPEVCLDIPLEPLPQPVACPDRNEMIALALARRGFLIQVGLFAQIVCLEVEAQGTSLHRKVQTFAAGADIHSRPVVQGTSNSEYRPGAVPPEMPIQLVGSRAERMQHAQSLHTRALALVEVTRNLITLEVEDAVLRWQEAAEQARQAQQAVTAGDKLSRALNRDFVAGQNVKVEEVVNAWVLASQAQSQYNEFLYRQLLALLDLERATGRGFCAGLFGVTVLAASPAPAAVSGTR